jgi:hypothetical protein
MRLDMSLNASGTLTAPPTDPAESGTVCCCERPDCAGTAACYREFAASETAWRVIADRRPRWVLANGQPV